MEKLSCQACLWPHAWRQTESAEAQVQPAAQEVLMAGPKPQPPLAPSAEDDQYIALASGLHIGDEASNPTRISMLLDFLTGMLGSPPEQRMSSQALFFFS